MAEEFQESDVVFSDHHHYHYHHNDDERDDDDEDDSCYFDNYRRQILVPQHNSRGMRSCKSSKSSSRRRSMTTKMSNSLPVNIPESILRCMDPEEQLEEEWEDEGMVPPHVIVGRRIAGKMAFSVCTGNGRTLKGRDLCRVRNSILRMTGFLET